MRLERRSKAGHSRAHGLWSKNRGKGRLERRDRIRRLASRRRLDSQFAPAMKIVGVISARYASTRFPGKPLHPILGVPLIERVIEQCRKATSQIGRASCRER